MLKNYIKIALRNLRKYKGYSLINILGLAVGIAVCMLIYQYVSHELSYDKYHAKSDRIYRVTLDHPQAHLAATPSMISPTLQRLFPEVEAGVRLFDVGKFHPLVIRYENRVFDERKLVYADSTLFKVFDFELSAGNPETALTQPNTVVLTRETAKKYFRDVSPLGKSMEIDGNDYQVTGVEVLKSELKKVPGIEAAAMASETPTSIRAGYGPDVEGLEEGPNFIITALRVTPEFTSTLNIEVVAGRSFTDGYFTRANQSEDREYAMMVNEATVRHFGLKPDELVGRRATIGGGGGPIVGVVKDFHFASLHRPIEPLFIFPRGSFNKLLISFNTTDVRETLEDTRAVWSRMFPQYPFEYEFLDQEYNALNQQEARAGKIFTSFTVLAIFIACLGLVGLASYMVEERSREIGVRKVLGATLIQVMTLFSKDFFILIATGFLIAVPIAWFAMDQWLQNFAYSIDIQWSIFLIAGILTIFIALLTVSYQAVKAARLDPVKSLRSE